MHEAKDPRSCYHRWETYTGLFEVFEHCINCGLKRDDQSKVYNKDFLEENFPKIAQRIREDEEKREEERKKREKELEDKKNPDYGDWPW